MSPPKSCQKFTQCEFQQEINVHSPFADNKCCSELTVGELTSAIPKMKRKGADGPDDIPPTFLKVLGPITLRELLQIFNASCLYADCPRIWRVATIIPILNKPVKLHPIDQLTLHHVSLNFSNVFLQIVYIASLSPTIFSAVSKQVFKTDVAVKTRF